VKKVEKGKDITVDDYGDYETAWCPGCGNFSILQSVKEALVACQLKPHEVLFVSGIGQAAKAPHYLNANVFNGLHGRALPVATGAKFANPKLNVIVESGDGCNYGEGGNHFLNAIRRNIDITMLVHNNQVYGLTKGQASPTSEVRMVTKSQPEGVVAEPFNAVAAAITLRASFVARAFSGMGDHLTKIIQEGITHRGFALIDILQPCVSFNKVNTHAWYEKRCKPLRKNYIPTRWEKSLKVATEWEKRIPLGVIYRNTRPPLGKKLKYDPLVGSEISKKQFEEVVKSFR
jgi:2-oxoglutarate ferredoxin oxidoreductase subunit beta